MIPKIDYLTGHARKKKNVNRGSHWNLTRGMLKQEQSEIIAIERCRGGKDTLNRLFIVSSKAETKCSI